MTYLKNQTGQILLVLLLVMTIGLGVALSIIGRSLSDISSSTKVEQSSRAFSVAEAGIERVLRGDQTNVDFLSENQSQAQVYDSGLLPAAGVALEYPYPPGISKEEIAQFWLANPITIPPSSPPTKYYTQSSIDIYWGLPNLSAADQAALEATVIYLNSNNGSIQSYKFWYDPNVTRAGTNGFAVPTCSTTIPTPPAFIVNTIFGPNRPFYCKATLNLGSLVPNPADVLLAIRSRFLYTSVSQPIALVPLGGCGQSCSLPPQAEIYTSTGSSGDTQRTVQLFSEIKVVPFYFDYAIFSKGDITK